MNNMRECYKQSGFSLVEVLVATVIGMIITLGIAGVINEQIKETRYLSEKLSAIDLDKTLVAALSDGSTCHYTLTQPTAFTFSADDNFPITAATFSELPANIKTMPILEYGPALAKVGQQASPLSRGLVVSNIKLQITNGNGDFYLGKWVVEFDSSKSLRPIRPLEVATNFVVDSRDPSQLKVIGCMTTSPAARCGVLGGTMENGNCQNYIGQSATAILRRKCTDWKLDPKTGQKLECLKREATITNQSGPSTAIKVVDNVSAIPGTRWDDAKHAGKLDGATCNTQEGWHLGGCFASAKYDVDVDLIPYSDDDMALKIGAGYSPMITGCITNDLNGNEQVISCVKNATTIDSAMPHVVGGGLIPPTQPPPHGGGNPPPHGGGGNPPPDYECEIHPDSCES